jgi:hypothetical protein
METVCLGMSVQFDTRHTVINIPGAMNKSFISEGRIYNSEVLTQRSMYPRGYVKPHDDVAEFKYFYF